MQSGVLLRVPGSWSEEICPGVVGTSGDGDQVFRIETTAGDERSISASQRNLGEADVLHPRVAVPFRQMQEQPFDADRCAGGKKRLDQFGPKAAEALEDQVGVLVG